MKPNVFSPWEVVGTDVLKAIEGEPEHSIITGNSLVAVLMVAIYPGTLAKAVRNRKAAELARCFSDFYAEKPELTLRLLLLIRDKWNDDTIAAKTRKHILVSPWHDRKTGLLTRDAKDTAIQAAIVDPKQKLTDPSAQAIKKARQRIKPPAWRPAITVELNAALQELKELGLIPV
jgi:hypothetical protein